MPSTLFYLQPHEAARFRESHLDLNHLKMLEDFVCPLAKLKHAIVGRKGA